MEKIVNSEEIRADIHRRYRVVFRRKGKVKGQRPFVEGSIITPSGVINYTNGNFKAGEKVLYFSRHHWNGFEENISVPADLLDGIWPLRWFGLDGKEGEGHEIFLLP